MVQSESDTSPGLLVHLWQFVRAPGVVAEPLPSTSSVGRAMAEQVDLARAKVVVELGPGTGVVTRELLKRLPADGRLLAIELSQAFAAQLPAWIGDPRLTVIQGSAESVDEHLRSHGVERADAVVSSLPFASMPASRRRSILARTHSVMRPGARFVAMQYVPFALLSILKEEFGQARIARWCPVNLPPLFVLTAG